MLNLNLQNVILSYTIKMLHFLKLTTDVIPITYFYTIYSIWFQFVCLVIEEPRQSSHLAPPTDNHGYEDVNIRSTNEETATTQLKEADMYENTQRLAGKYK